MVKTNFMSLDRIKKKKRSAEQMNLKNATPSLKKPSVLQFENI